MEHVERAVGGRRRPLAPGPRTARCGTGAPATVTITVARPNRPAVAVDDALTTPHGTALVARTGADPGRSWPWGWPLC